MVIGYLFRTCFMCGEEWRDFFFKSFLEIFFSFNLVGLGFVCRLLVVRVGLGYF